LPSSSGGTHRRGLITIIILISYSYYLAQFERWYMQAGTPVLTAAGAYDAAAGVYSLTLSQACPPTPGQAAKEPFHIPVVVGLLDAESGAEVVASAPE